MTESRRVNVDLRLPFKRADGTVLRTYRVTVPVDLPAYDDPWEAVCRFSLLIGARSYPVTLRLPHGVADTVTYKHAGIRAL